MVVNLQFAWLVVSFCALILLATFCALHYCVLYCGELINKHDVAKFSLG